MILFAYRLLQPVLELSFRVIVIAVELLCRYRPELREKFDKLVITYRMRSPHGVPAYLEVDFDDFTKDRAAKDRPIWIHAASGEYEYAKPLVRELHRKGQKVFVTYFSPTYRSAIEGDPGVQASCALPLDNASEIRDLIVRLNPKCLLIARTDTWPNLIYECAKANVPTLLFSATFHAQSARVGRFAALLTRAVYPYLTAAHGVTPDDCRLLEKFGVPNTLCAGDTRYDQVLARLETPKKLIAGLRSYLKEEVLVAGSVWKEDLEHLVPGICRSIEALGNFSAVLVPHEVSYEAIERLCAEIKARNLRVTTYSKLEDAQTKPMASMAGSEKFDVLVVDRVGILAELYQLGRVAFVGGSFRKTVHSVMEPLAAGCLTIVGPKHLNNREAIEFQNERLPGFDHAPVVCVKSAEELRERLTAILMSLAKTKISTQVLLQDLIRRRGGATTKALDWIEGL